MNNNNFKPNVGRFMAEFSSRLSFFAVVLLLPCVNVSVGQTFHCLDVPVAGIRVEQNCTTFPLNIREIEVLDLAGNNIAPTWVASASGSGAGTAPGGLNDGNYNPTTHTSGWHSNGVNPQFGQLLGAVPVLISEVRVMARYTCCPRLGDYNLVLLDVAGNPIQRIHRVNGTGCASDQNGREDILNTFFFSNDGVAPTATAPAPEDYGCNGDIRAATASVVTPVGVTVNTSATDLFPVGNLLTMSGLTLANIATTPHSGNTWVTRALTGPTVGNNYFAWGGPTPNLIFDLGSIQVLTDFVAWQYGAGNSSMDMVIEFSVNGTGGPFMNPIEIAMTATTGLPQIFSFGESIAANAVRVSIRSNFHATLAGGDRVGLAEVRFLSAPVPEPMLTVTNPEGDFRHSIKHVSDVRWTNECQISVSRTWRVCDNCDVGETVVEHYFYNLTPTDVMNAVLPDLELGCIASTNLIPPPDFIAAGTMASCGDVKITLRSSETIEGSGALPVPLLDYDAESEFDLVWDQPMVAPAALNYNLTAAASMISLVDVDCGVPMITRAYRFTGNGGGQNDDLNTIIDVTQDASWELWFRPAPGTDTDRLYEVGGTGTGMSLLYDGAANEVIFTVDFGTGTNQRTIQGGSALLDTEDFHQLVAVYDRDENGTPNDRISLYIDGVLVATDNSANNMHNWNGGDDSTLGVTGTSLAQTTPANTNFEGDIAKFRIYPSALTAENRQALYAEAFGGDECTDVLMRTYEVVAACETQVACQAIAYTLNQAPPQITAVTAPFDNGCEGDPLVVSLANRLNFEAAAGPALDEGVNDSDGAFQGNANRELTDAAPSACGGSQSASFDGNNDRIVLTGDKGIGGTEPRSISAWIRTTDQDASIVSWGTDAPGRRITFRVQNTNPPADGNLRVEVNGGYIVGDSMIADGNWHHVAMTWENDGTPNVQDVKLYVDGVLETIGASASQTIDTGNSADIRIGESINGSSDFSGLIDDVRIYSTALSADAIALLAAGVCEVLPSASFTSSDPDNNIVSTQMVYESRFTNECTVTVTRRFRVEDCCGLAAEADEVYSYSLDPMEIARAELPRLDLGCITHTNQIPPPDFIAAGTKAECGTLMITQLMTQAIMTAGVTLTPCESGFERVYSVTGSCTNILVTQVVTYVLNTAPPLILELAPWEDFECSGDQRSNRFALIDIQPDGGRTVAGGMAISETLTPGNNNNGGEISGAPLVSNAGDPFTISIDDTDQSGVDTGRIDWRDRGNGSGTDSLVPLGEDFIKNNAGIVRVTLGGLPAGAYQATSFHIDPSFSQNEAIHVFVNNGDGNGFVDTGADGNANFTLGGVNGLTDAAVQGSAASFSFTSDGINDVIIIFDGTMSADTELPLNGLDIIRFDPTYGNAYPFVVTDPDGLDTLVSTQMVREVRTTNECKVTVTRTWRVEDCCGLWHEADEVYSYNLDPVAIANTLLPKLDLGCIASTNLIPPPDFIAAGTHSDCGELSITLEETRFSTNAYVVLRDDPLIFWRFEEDDKADGNSAVNSACEASSLGPAGDGLYRDVVGHVVPGALPGPAASFGTSTATSGGTGDRVSLQMTSFPTMDLSVEMWVRGSAAANNEATLFSWHGPGTAGGSDNRFMLIFQSGAWRIFINGSNHNTGVAEGDILDGSWHHVAITRNSTSGLTTLYIDGAVAYSAVHQAGTAISTASGTLTLAQEQDDEDSGFSNGQKFVGDLDEFALFDRELTDEEVAFHYDPGEVDACIDVRERVYEVSVGCSTATVHQFVTYYLNTLPPQITELAPDTDYGCEGDQRRLNITLNGLDGLVDGVHPVELDSGGTVDAYVESYNGEGWLLVGRGREGWEFDTDGPGNEAAVTSDLGTSAAFAPAGLTDATINDLLARVGTDLSNVEIRLKRATDPNGIDPYQEVRWQMTGRTTWSWDFDAGDATFSVVQEIIAGPGVHGPGAGNTRDFDPGGSDFRRVFTWLWADHAAQGFSYGSDVNFGSNSTEGFLYERNNENHAIPYTEVYIRVITPNLAAAPAVDPTYGNAYTFTATDPDGLDTIVDTNLVGEARTTNDCQVTVFRTWRVEDCCGQWDEALEVYQYAVTPEIMSESTLPDLNLGCIESTDAIPPPDFIAQSTMASCGAVSIKFVREEANAVPVTDGLTLWLDATDSSTLFQDAAGTIPATGTGDDVLLWRDKSQTGADAVQGAVPGAPVLDLAGMGGQPTVRFTASDMDGLRIPGLDINTHEYTIFTVDRYSGATTERTLTSYTPGNNWLTGKWDGQNAHYNGDFVYNGNDGVDTTTPVVGVAVGSPVVPLSQYYLNGLNVTTINTTTGNPRNLALGGAGAFNEYSDADMSEVIVYDRVLSDAERQAVEQYLSRKYNIATATAVPNDCLQSFTRVYDVTTGCATQEVRQSVSYVLNSGGPKILSVAPYEDFECAGDLRPLAEPPAGLQTFFDFNTPEADNTVYDAVDRFPGMLLNGATIGEAGSGRTGGVHDRALDVTAGAGSSLFLSGDTWAGDATVLNTMSVSFWQRDLDPNVNLSDTSFHGTGPGNSRNFFAHVPWNDFTIYFDTGGGAGAGQRISGASPVSSRNNEWHHYAFIKDGDTKSVYVDGVLAFSGNNTVALLDFIGFYIGSSVGAQGINGLIDDFAIWDSALDAATVSDLAAGGSTLQPEVDPSYGGTQPWIVEDPDNNVICTQLVREVRVQHDCQVTVERVWRVEDCCGNFDEAVETYTYTEDPDVLLTDLLPRLDAGCIDSYGDIPPPELSVIGSEVNCGEVSYTFIGNQALTDASLLEDCEQGYERVYRVTAPCPEIGTDPATWDIDAVNRDLDGWTLVNGEPDFGGVDGDGVHADESQPSPFPDDEGPHETFLLRSPQFVFANPLPPGDVVFVELGAGSRYGSAGVGAPAYATPQEILTFNGGVTDDTGQKGVALYDTRLRQYVYHFYKNLNGGVETLTADEALLAAAGVNFSSVFELHFYDTDEGGNGWTQLNDAQVEGLLIADRLVTQVVTYTLNSASPQIFEVAPHVDYACEGDPRPVNPADPDPTYGDLYPFTVQDPDLLQNGDLPGYTFLGSFNGHTYYVSDNPADSWALANQAANLLGGHLVTITSEEEFAFLNPLVGEVWLGLTDGDDFSTEGNFVWVTGEPFGMNGFGANDFQNWADTQPNGSHDTAVMAADGTWDDVSHATDRLYVVEFEGNDRIVSTQLVMEARIQDGCQVTVQRTWRVEDCCGNWHEKMETYSYTRSVSDYATNLFESPMHLGCVEDATHLPGLTGCRQETTGDVYCRQVTSGPFNLFDPAATPIANRLEITRTGTSVDGNSLGDGDSMIVQFDRPVDMQLNLNDISDPTGERLDISPPPDVILQVGTGHQLTTNGLVFTVVEGFVSGTDTIAIWTNRDWISFAAFGDTMDVDVESITFNETYTELRDTCSGDLTWLDEDGLLLRDGAGGPATSFADVVPALTPTPALCLDEQFCNLDIQQVRTQAVSDVDLLAAITDDRCLSGFERVYELTGECTNIFYTQVITYVTDTGPPQITEVAPYIDYGCTNNPRPLSSVILAIADLFNTGVDDAGVTLAAGLDDPHYELVVVPSGSTLDETGAHPAWVANDADSGWIGPPRGGPQNAPIGPAGTYIFETRFTLPGHVNLDSVSITGAWATDNPGDNIRLNGVPLGITNPTTTFTELHPFAIHATNGAPFRCGVNVLQFEVRNTADGYIGLRVDDLVGSFTVNDPTYGMFPFITTDPDGVDKIVCTQLVREVSITNDCRVTVTRTWRVEDCCGGWHEMDESFSYLQPEADSAGYALVEDAELLPDGCIELVSTLENRGAAWANIDLDLSKSFRLEYDILVDAGYSLRLIMGPPTFRSAFPADEFYSELNDVGIGETIFIDTSFGPNSGAPTAISTAPLANGQPHILVMEWEPATMLLSVSVDGVAQSSLVVDLEGNLGRRMTFGWIGEPMFPPFGTATICDRRLFFTPAGGPAFEPENLDLGCIQDEGQIPAADFSFLKSGCDPYDVMLITTQAAAPYQLWINEIDVDSPAIEVAGDVGLNLDGYVIQTYLNNGQVADEVNVMANPILPSPGINGIGFSGVSPVNAIPSDGAVALVDPDGQVLQFFSFGFSVTAVEGAAAGLTAVDIGLTDPGANFSLQLAGTGRRFEDFVWTTDTPISIFAANLQQVLEDHGCDPTAFERVYMLMNNCSTNILVTQRVSYILDTAAPFIQTVSNFVDYGCEGDLRPLSASLSAIVAHDADGDDTLVSTNLVMEERIRNDCFVTVRRTWRVEDCCGRWHEKVETYAYTETAAALATNLLSTTVDVGCVSSTDLIPNIAGCRREFTGNLYCLPQSGGPDAFQVCAAGTLMVNNALEVTISTTGPQTLGDTTLLGPQDRCTVQFDRPVTLSLEISDLDQVVDLLDISPPPTISSLVANHSATTQGMVWTLSGNGLAAEADTTTATWEDITWISFAGDSSGIDRRIVVEDVEYDEVFTELRDTCTGQRSYLDASGAIDVSGGIGLPPAGSTLCDNELSCLYEIQQIRTQALQNAAMAPCGQGFERVYEVIGECSNVVVTQVVHYVSDMGPPVITNIAPYVDYGCLGDQRLRQPAIPVNQASPGPVLLSINGMEVPGYVENHNGENWILIGRGREGWEFDADGQGTPADVASGLGTSAAFSPAAYSDAMVNALLTQAGTAIGDVELRIKRATDTAGTAAYQEARWSDLSAFTWNMGTSTCGNGSPGGGFVFTYDIISGPGAGSYGPRNSDETFGGTVGNNEARTFTWSWGGHACERGFSYGSSVNGLANGTSFIWDDNSSNHGIPYTEVYIRSTNPNTPLLVAGYEPTYGGAYSFDATDPDGDDTILSTQLMWEVRITNECKVTVTRVWRVNDCCDNWHEADEVYSYDFTVQGLVQNGAIPGGGLPGLATLESIAPGPLSLTADGQPIDTIVEANGGYNWLLIGHGREGWEFDADGPGMVGFGMGLGTSAAFAPAALTDAMINDLLDQAGIDLSQVEIRLKRATDTAGTAEYQEVRWRNFGAGAATTWTWDLDTTTTYPNTDMEIVSGPQVGHTRTDDTRDFDDNGTGFARVFTFSWNGHGFEQGFSYGDVVEGVNNDDSDTFLWEFSNEGHAIPYTEVYMRMIDPIEPFAAGCVDSTNNLPTIDLSGLSASCGSLSISSVAFEVLDDYAVPAFGFSVTNGLSLWLDASDAGTLFQDEAGTLPSGPGDPVRLWMDKAPWVLGQNRIGNNAVQENYTSQPIREPSAMAGRGAVRFDNIDNQGLAIQCLNIESHEYTIFIVDKYWDTAHGRSLTSRTAGRNWLIGKHGGENGFYAEGWVYEGPVNQNNSIPMLGVGVATGTESHYYLNGIDVTQNDTPVGNPGMLVLGGRGNFNQPSDVDIAEVILYERALTDTERQEVEAYLMTKYSIAGAPLAPFGCGNVATRSYDLATGCSTTRVFQTIEYLENPGAPVILATESGGDLGCLSAAPDLIPDLDSFVYTNLVFTDTNGAACYPTAEELRLYGFLSIMDWTLETDCEVVVKRTYRLDNCCGESTETSIEFRYSIPPTLTLPTNWYQQIAWTDWTAADATADTALGSITADGVTYNLDYDGDVYPNVIVNGTWNWANNLYGSGPNNYIDLPNGDPASGTLDDLITSSTPKGVPHTITFDQPTPYPVVMNWLSIGRSVATSGSDFPVQFNFGTLDFEILSSAAGTLEKLEQDGMHILRGVEGHGSIRFPAGIQQISWQSSATEEWHGFQVGLLTPSFQVDAGCVDSPAGFPSLPPLNLACDAQLTLIDQQPATVTPWLLPPQRVEVDPTWFGPIPQYDVANLFDGQPEVGTANHVEQQFATSIMGPASSLMLMDFGHPIRANILGYAQRWSATAANDSVTQMELWFENTDPGGATAPPRTPDVTLEIPAGNAGIFLEYPFPEGFAGQYVVARLSGNNFYHGGAELRLGCEGMQAVEETWQVEAECLTNRFTRLVTYQPDIGPPQITNLAPYTVYGCDWPEDQAARIRILADLIGLDDPTSDLYNDPTYSNLISGWAVTDPDGLESIVSTNHVRTVRHTNDCLVTVERTWRITDCCGNWHEAVESFQYPLAGQMIANDMLPDLAIGCITSTDAIPPPDFIAAGTSASCGSLQITHLRDEAGSTLPVMDGLVLWMDASDATTLFQDEAGTIPAGAGQPVARWDDKSPSGLVFTQGSAGNRPVYSAALAGLNGQPGVTFTGGSGGDALTSTTGNSTGVAGNDDRTVISVWQSTGFTGQNYQHTLHFGNTDCNRAYGHSVSRSGDDHAIGNHYWCDGFNAFANRSTDASIAVSTWDGDGGTGANGLDSWYVNGEYASASDRAALNTGTDQYQLGSRLSPFTEGFSGHLVEVVQYDRILSDEERRTVEAALAAKYAIAFEASCPTPVTFARVYEVSNTCERVEVTQNISYVLDHSPADDRHPAACRLWLRRGFAPADRFRGRTGGDRSGWRHAFRIPGERSACQRGMRSHRHARMGSHRLLRSFGYGSGNLPVHRSAV